MMVHEDKIEGIIAVIDDGIKDAHMQIDWACDAKEDGERDTAAMFHSEATKRLTGAKDWYEKCREMLLDPKNSEAVAKAFVRRMDEKLSHAIARVSGFKN